MYSITETGVSRLSPAAFASDHKEEDLQRWVDQYPALLNDGIPMLSLGTEIFTSHGHYIDNLYIDGNGTIVIAELKRGRNTRDLHAQVLEYGAFADGLGWSDIEGYCKARHGVPLNDAYKELFGRDLEADLNLTHRLLVVAESYDQRMLDMTRYLIKRGFPIVLIDFNYFPGDDVQLLEPGVTLGQIPEQLPAGFQPLEDKENTPREEDWFLPKISEVLVQISADQEWPLQHRISKKSVSFANGNWTSAYSELQMMVSTWAKDTVTLWLQAENNSLPGLAGFLEDSKEHWVAAWPAKQSASAAKANKTAYMLRLPAPTQDGDDAMELITNQLSQMTETLMPLLGDFFSRTNSEN